MLGFGVAGKGSYSRGHILLFLLKSGVTGKGSSLRGHSLPVFVRVWGGPSHGLGELNGVVYMDAPGKELRLTASSSSAARALR